MVPVVWRRVTGSSKRKTATHVGIEPGAPALCGRLIPADSREPEGEGALEDSLRELCTGCARRLRGRGPWTDEDGWIRPYPDYPRPYVGNPNEAWRLNELTWQRLVALAKGQKMTRRSVAELGRMALETLEDPKREHVARALDAASLATWATIVYSGWWPDAGLEDQAGRLLAAWIRATAEEDET
jgi:hypothetical protein